MPGWTEILNEVKGVPKNVDVLRDQYIKEIADYTKRNVIALYSGWLQVNTHPVNYSINDRDLTGLMACCKGIDKKKGLDLILHTPGGDIAATEAIIHYLFSFFDGNIRAFVPQLAMSAGTLIATSCTEIWMGRQSSIGPVDPQFGVKSAVDLLEEFDMIFQEIKADNLKVHVWLPVLQQISPTDIILCKRAVEWSTEILRTNLRNGMFQGLEKTKQKQRIEKVVRLLGQPKSSKVHNRHINADKAKANGLVIKRLEDDNQLQDKILSLHHLLCITFELLGISKIICNNQGATYMLTPTPNKQ